MYAYPGIYCHEIDVYKSNNGKTKLIITHNIIHGKYGKITKIIHNRHHQPQASIDRNYRITTMFSPWK